MNDSCGMKAAAGEMSEAENCGTDHFKVAAATVSTTNSSNSKQADGRAGQRAEGNSQSSGQTRDRHSIRVSVFR